MTTGKLKITFEKGEVRIQGDKEGLEYLADCCRRIIGKTDPSGHWHLSPEMDNLLNGSLPTSIEYAEEPE